MSKAILLIRVSTEHQDLSQQTEKVKEAALNDGFKSKDIIILEDKESAVKLSEEERNGLNNLKWHIEHDDITCVYAYEISRISRQPSILYSIRDYLIKHQVQLIILNPYMKMLKDDGNISESANIFFGIFSSMAEDRKSSIFSSTPMNFTGAFSSSSTANKTPPFAVPSSFVTIKPVIGRISLNCFACWTAF